LFLDHPWKDFQQPHSWTFWGGGGAIFGKSRRCWFFPMGGGFIIKLNPPCTLQNCWGTLLLLSLIDVIGSFALLNSYRPHKNNFAVLKQTPLKGSHEHVDKLLPPPWVVVLLSFHHLLLPGWGTWMDGWWDEWMERTTTQGYYISRLIYKILRCWTFGGSL